MRLLGIALSLVLLFVTSSAAQQTRQEEIQRKREEKARTSTPERRNRVEAMMFKLEDDLLMERLFNPPRGLYVRSGSITEGSGISGGPGFRYSTHAVDFRVSGAVSTRKYWIGETAIVFPRLDTRTHLYGEVLARVRNFPQEDFFGVGPNSAFLRRSDYTYRDSAVSGGAGVRYDEFAAGGRVEYLNPSIGRGEDPRFRSTDELFSDADAPGLARQPDFLRFEAFTSYDTTDRPVNPRSGIRYRVSFNRYNDRDFDSYSFRRWDADLQHYIPFFHGHRTIALRGLASFSEADDGDRVPFYLMRHLGGPYTLRGFRSFRFRDTEVLLLQAEYRWEINAVTSGALFYDTGMVAPRRQALSVARFRKDYGFGLRVGAGGAGAFRADIAFGSGEGLRYLIRFDNVF